MKILFFIALLFVLALAIGMAWRTFDHVADRRESDRLLALQTVDPELFTLEMVADLPDPARRFFAFAIDPGTSLFTAATLKMTGTFRLGTRDAPREMAMTATQVLAAPYGFVWKMEAGAGFGHVSGSDSGRWTRFWLNNLMPVARVGTSAHHRLSAFGRYASEALIWTPAAVLPSDFVRWEKVDDQTARMTMTFDGMEQAVDVKVADDGRPLVVTLQRWSNQNPDHIWRYQTFGGKLAQHRLIDGFRIPTHVEGGYFLGTDDYFAFYEADIVDAQFEGLK